MIRAASVSGYQSAVVDSNNERFFPNRHTALPCCAIPDVFLGWQHMRLHWSVVRYVRTMYKVATGITEISQGNISLVLAADLQHVGQPLQTWFRFRTSLQLISSTTRPEEISLRTAPILTLVRDHYETPQAHVEHDLTPKSTPLYLTYHVQNVTLSGTPPDRYFEMSFWLRRNATQTLVAACGCCDGCWTHLFEDPDECQDTLRRSGEPLHAGILEAARRMILIPGKLYV